MCLVKICNYIILVKICQISPKFLHSIDYTLSFYMKMSMKEELPVLQKQLVTLCICLILMYQKLFQFLL